MITQPPREARAATANAEVELETELTNDPHTELHEAVIYLLSCIKDVRQEGKETEQTARANTYLQERLMNYLAMMRTRYVDEAYEFLHTPDGGWGWYYKAQPGDIKNWHGPFKSRKAAVAAKLDRPFVPKNRLKFIEQKLLNLPTGAQNAKI